MFVKGLNYNLPDKNGFFGEFGGAFVPEDFKAVLQRLDVAFEEAKEDNSSNLVNVKFVQFELQLQNGINEIKQAIGSVFNMQEKKGILASTFQKITNKVLPSNDPTNVTRKCVGCHAILSGLEGDVVVCEYCDTKQTL